MTDKNPYKRKTQKHRIFEILKDLRWHCSDHELPGSQPAKALQMMRRDGFEMERTGSNWEKRVFCKTCGRTTSHRRLMSLDKKRASVSRIAFSQAASKKIRAHYGGKDEILGYAPTGRSVEIDHRVPEIRWKSDEGDVPKDLTENEIEERYMLLVREHNLLKSRYCERCKRTSKRQPLLGVSFFYEGGEDYDDKLGCVGCGWHDPRKWKKELNDLLRDRRKKW